VYVDGPTVINKIITLHVSELVLAIAGVFKVECNTTLNVEKLAALDPMENYFIRFISTFPYCIFSLYFTLILLTWRKW